MITYQKVSQLRLERATWPQAPFWQATTVAPYGAPRGHDIAVNYLTLTATGKAKREITVTRSVAGRLEREQRLDEPVLVESADATETVFRRGEEALRILQSRSIRTMQLISTAGRLPAIEPATTSSVVISCWPLLVGDLSRLFRRASVAGFQWGALVPAILPPEVAEESLREIADLAAENGALFLASAPLDLDISARHTLAAMLGGDTGAWQSMFDTDRDDESVDTERLVAKLAHERSIGDRVTTPGLTPYGNWSAAIRLSVAGARLLRLKRDVELGWTLLRSAKLVAQLHKPIDRIAAAASLSIIQSLDPTSVAALEAWLRRDDTSFFDEIDEDWRSVGG
ncbi:MAG: hypothetical protein HYU52_04015 [Acidobacteria bacterium]|nr:hypothetical protein [Acidobacteriota bacterium]